MKNLFYALVLALSFGASAETVLLSNDVVVQTFIRGVVVDERTGEPLAGAEVLCEGRSVFTNFAGEFLLETPATKEDKEVEVEVRLISYPEKRQKISKVTASSPLVIQLRS